MLRCAPLLLALLAAGCGERSTTPEPPDLAMQADRVAELEARLDQLDRRLQAARHARGAYTKGPTLSVDRRARTTILDDLHRLETELREARLLLDQRIDHIRNQNRDLEQAKDRNQRLQEQITLLKNYERKTKIAQDALRTAHEDIDRLDAELRSSEHQRLEIEKVFAEFATEFLKLRALDTKKFDLLQKQLRDRIERYLPDPEHEEDRHAVLPASS